MESFYNIHYHLLEHIGNPVRRSLANEIDWSHNLIGIKGSRGIGKTTLLLQFALEKFGKSRSCLYIDMNNFYFCGRRLVDFAGEFHNNGGRVLLIDQIFKYPGWSKELRECHELYPQLKIIFAGSSVMRLKEGNDDLSDIVKSYNLRGFSFREFLNISTMGKFTPFTLEDIVTNHKEIAKNLMKHVNPTGFFDSYLHHGYYPFFLEKKNFYEKLLKTMNMMIEVDLLFLKQIELKYLPKLRQLFYELAINSEEPSTNISKLAESVDVSRATIMSYLKGLYEARLINIIYHEGEEFPKKPARIMLHNTNLAFSLPMKNWSKQMLYETFFYNALFRMHSMNIGNRQCTFIADGKYKFKICSSKKDIKNTSNNNIIYVYTDIEIGEGNIIPLWLFGFLY